MEDKKAASEVKKKRWTLKREIEARTEELGKLSEVQPEKEQDQEKKDKAQQRLDDRRKATLEHLKSAQEVRNARMESVAKVAKDIGSLALFGVLVVFAYSIDKSDLIPRNKVAQGLVNKFFHL